METNARTVTSDNILMEQKQNDQTPKKKKSKLYSGLFATL
jgi:hypothetical protein